MGDKTGIEWTDATWNPVAGCSVESPGCTNCYAMKMAARLEKMGGKIGEKYRGLTKPGKKGPVWNGRVRLDEAALDQPLRWKRPRRIFVNSMSDLFHDALLDEDIDKVFAVMALCPPHTFQLLTKRPERMRAYLSAGYRQEHIAIMAEYISGLDRFQPDGSCTWPSWPLPNVWLGTSVENQDTADARIPHILATPAAGRFVSMEPLLGPVDLEDIPNHLGMAECQGHINALRGYAWECDGPDYVDTCNIGSALDWVIVGGESGPRARPMHPNWARALRDQCSAAGIPFMFKQWGEWAPNGTFLSHSQHHELGTIDGQVGPDGTAVAWARRSVPKGSIIEGDRLLRVGKRAAGRLLDNMEHNGMPGDFAPQGA